MIRLIPVAFLSFFLILAATTTGCESLTAATPGEEETFSEGMQSVAAALADELQMDEQQVRQMMGKHARQWKQPGFLWYLAVTMEQRMSEEEKARLFERAHRIQQHRKKQRIRRIRAFFHTPARKHPLWRLLNEEQRASFREILTRYRKQFRELIQKRQNGDLSSEAFLRQAMALREQFREETTQLLTHEQKQRLEERKQKMKAHQKKRRAAIRTAMQQALQLTDEQMEQLAEVRSHRKEAAKQLRERFRTGAINVETLKEEWKKLREETNQQLQSILTPEQYEAVKIHRALSLLVKQHMQARRQHQR